MKIKELQIIHAMATSNMSSDNEKSDHSAPPKRQDDQNAESGRDNGAIHSEAQQTVQGNSKLTATTNPSAEPPNGGSWAWLQVAGSFFLIFGTW